MTTTMQVERTFAKEGKNSNSSTKPFNKTQFALLVITALKP
jgi:hypothetical protein